MRQGTRPPGPLSWLHFISLADDFPFNIRGRILERFKANPYLKNNNSFRRLIRLWGPFLERQENFSGRRQILWSKPVAVWQFIAHKPVSFASLTDSFIMSFSELLEPWSWMQTRQTRNSFSGPKSYLDFRETGPCARPPRAPGQNPMFCNILAISRELIGHSFYPQLEDRHQKNFIYM